MKRKKVRKTIKVGPHGQHYKTKDGRVWKDKGEYDYDRDFEYMEQIRKAKPIAKTRVSVTRALPPTSYTDKEAPIPSAKEFFTPQPKPNKQPQSALKALEKKIAQAGIKDLNQLVEHGDVINYFDGWMDEYVKSYLDDLQNENMELYYEEIDSCDVAGADSEEDAVKMKWLKKFDGNPAKFYLDQFGETEFMDVFKDGLDSGNIQLEHDNLEQEIPFADERAEKYEREEENQKVRDMYRAEALAEGIDTITSSMEEEAEEYITEIADEHSVDDIVFRNNIRYDYDSATYHLDLNQIYADNEEKVHWSDETFMDQPNSIKYNSKAELDELVSHLKKKFGKKLKVKRG